MTRQFESEWDAWQETHRRQLVARRLCDYRPDPPPVSAADAAEEGDAVHETDEAIAERAGEMAEILLGVWGDDALTAWEDAYGGAQDRLANYSPDQPRGPDGRFIKQFSAAAVAAARKKIKENLKKPATAENLKDLHSHLSILTAKQLGDLKKEHELSASGKNKAELAAKIADRLHRGRRTTEQSPSTKKEPKKKAEKPEPAPTKTGSIAEGTTPHGHKVQVSGNVSPKFAEEMQSAYSGIHPNAANAIEKAGGGVTVVGRVTDYLPELKGVTPSGWPAGSTWDGADGLYHENARRAVVAEKYVNGSGKEVNTTRGDRTLRHELGHAWDHALGHHHNDPEFVAAYEKDAAAVRSSAVLESVNGYFLQPGRRGREEALAEGFAVLHGGGCGYRDEPFRQQWPNVLKHLEAKIRGAS